MLCKHVNLVVSVWHPSKKRASLDMLVSSKDPKLKWTLPLWQTMQSHDKVVENNRKKTDYPVRSPCKLWHARLHTQMGVTHM